MAKALHGRIFLGSPFEQLLYLREEIWRRIQHTRWLKCVSLQYAHSSSRPPFVITDIAEQIADSSHFIFLVGPNYGTKISELVRPGVLELPDEHRNARGFSFTEFELSRAVAHLHTMRADDDSPLPAPEWFRAHLLVVRLWQEGVNDDNGKVDKMLKKWVRKLGVEYINVDVADAKLDDKRRGLVPIDADRDRRLFGTVDEFLDAIERDVRARVNSFLTQHQIDSVEHIQIAGWSGLEDYDHYAAFMSKHHVRDDHLSFLTMDRSVISLPAKPKYYPRRYYPQRGTSRHWLDFDFVIADVELVQHYIKTESIGSFRREVEAHLHQRLGPVATDTGHAITQLVRDLTEPAVSDISSHVRGIPLLYGFNEFLVKDGAERRGLRATGNLGSQDWSYSEFDLRRLLRDTTLTIGIWGWWLASFPIILLSHWSSVDTRSKIMSNIEAPLDGPWESREFLRQFGQEGWPSVTSFVNWLKLGAANNSSREWLARILRSTTARLLEEVEDIQDKAGRLMLFESLDQKKAQAQSTDVLIGSSSAVLPTWSRRRSDPPFRPVVPREGVFAWINCVCPYNKEDFGNIHAQLLDYLLEPGVQESFSRPASPSLEPYIGIPVIEEALQKFMKTELYRPIVETIRSVQPRLSDKAKKGRPTRVVALRPFFSETWPLFEYSWQELIRGLKPFTSKA